MPASGTAVARTARIARRVTALLAMVALIGLLLVLIWRVYLHHQHDVPSDEPTVVELDPRTGTPKVARLLLSEGKGK